MISDFSQGLAVFRTIAVVVAVLVVVFVGGGLWLISSSKMKGE